MEKKHPYAYVGVIRRRDEGQNTLEKPSKCPS
jgi:hypothetical protein